MSILVRNHALMFAMLFSMVLAITMKPGDKIADYQEKINLESMIPREFGDWKEIPKDTRQIINPQQKEMIQKIYNQTLSRSYINSNNDVVMLSIAYGEDQRDGNQLHYPEVCYPAQGFKIGKVQPFTLKTNFGDIKARHILAVMGNRSEPITYWTTLGNQVVRGGMESKLAQLNYGFKGQIPDGLLLRVSSITEDTSQGFLVQEEFVRFLISSLPDNTRLKIMGIKSNKTSS